MSLFDVIKYPISDIPTVEELEALPKDIWDKWIDESSWGGPDYKNGRLKILLWFKLVASIVDHNIPELQQDVRLLRKIIKDYNEPI
jgi:hypothetical protein